MNIQVKKIKVVVGINDFRVGGAQKVVSDIISKIGRETFDIQLITLSQSPEQSSFYETVPAGVVVHRLHFKNFYDIHSWLNLRQLLKSTKPDIVWSHLYFSNTVFRVLKLFVGYKVVTVEHNTYVNKTFAQRCVDWCLAFVTFKIVAVSDQVADFTSKQEHIARKKFKTILNGVDVTTYSARAESTDVASLKNSLGFSLHDKIIITVGQLIKQKNHSLLIEAFAQFAATHEEYKLIIVGEGQMRGELEKRIQGNGLADSVRLLGIQKDTPAFYAASDFFVLPSLFEGFALVCIEAMACGLPVVTTHVAGPDVYISENKDGFFFKPTVEDLVKTLNLVADMDELKMAHMRQSAREKAGQYDIGSSITAYQHLFIECVRTGGVA